MTDLLFNSKPHVVIVDDQVENLQLLVSLLSDEFALHPFADGASGLRYLASGRPADLILLDVVMPEPDGHEVCRQVRAMRWLDDVPVVFLTALDSMEDEAKGFALGALDYITKPLSSSIVLARVRNHVRLSRALRMIQEQNNQLERAVAERTQELSDQRLKLKELNYRNELAVNAAVIGVWDWFVAENRLLWDERMYRLYGVNPEHFSGSFDDWRRCVHPDDLTWCEDELHQSLDGLKAFDIEFRVIWPDGSLHYLRGTAAVEHDGNGAPLRMTGVNYDVTRRKEDEQALVRALGVAQAANRAKSNFVANVSHEIRTPLNVVLGLAQVLSHEALTANQLEMVTHIQTAGESLLGILNDVLDLAKIEAGQLRIESRPFAPADLIGKVTRLLGRSAADKGLVLRVESPSAALGTLKGDVLRLQQILVNLTGNAIKFTAQGEVILRVRPLADNDHRAHLRFEVSDTGIGIAPETLGQLFAPFAQADDSITRRFGGTGLGLSICKRLAELMGGTIGAESTPGEGSTFWVALPFERTETPEAPPRSATVVANQFRSGLRDRHFLVVDDSFINQEVAVKMLGLSGAQATLAANGREALDVLRAAPDRFDAVLMDIQMPVMDGLNATRAIRDELGLKTLPVIALTAGVLAEEQDAARAAGMNGILPKPMDLQRMVTLLNECMAPRRQTDAAARPTASTVPVAPGEVGGGFPELPGVNRVWAAQHLEHDRRLFIRLLQLLIQQHADTATETRRALSDGDNDTAGRRMHQLRSAAGNLGALDLMAMAAALETAIKNSETEGEEALLTLEVALDDLIAAGTRWLEGETRWTSMASPPTASPQPTLDQLADLRKRLRDRDLDAEFVFDAQREALLDIVGGEQTQLLERAIRGLRFAEALAILDQAPVSISLESSTQQTAV